MVKYHILDLAQLLVVQTIQMRAADIISSVCDASVFQSALVRHFSSDLPLIGWSGEGMSAQPERGKHI
jgi:hypothetical protein